MTEEKNTMEIWDQVSKTDPGHTKHVAQRGGFTAIDAHSQVMAATKMFGPVGTGWGYETKYGFHQTTRGEDFVWCDLTLWYRATVYWEGMLAPNNKATFGPIRGICALQGLKADGKWKPSDHDAAKKAMTDALTKGLSHLGFNADVFLGMFDDNKYVSQLKKDVAAEAEKEAREYTDARNSFIAGIKACTKQEGIDIIMKDSAAWLGTLQAGTLMELKQWVAKQRKEITDGSK
jgi:hypothetical protein